MKRYTQEEINKLITIEDNIKYIKNVNFDNCDLSNLDLSFIKFIDCSFKGAYLVRANLEVANLEGADLYSANLEGANLEGAYLYNANLEGAKFKRKGLKGILDKIISILKGE